MLDVPTELGGETDARTDGGRHPADGRERSPLASPPEERFVDWVETWARA
jgi:hypothetical protein